MGKDRSTHHWSEDFALDQLQSKGLRLVERNYRTRRGEIDLILREEASLVFVEVRYRASSAFGRPEETVDTKKQSRLRFTAEFSCSSTHGYDTVCRFDVFAVSGKMPNPDWQWIRNAFLALDLAPVSVPIIAESFRIP